MHLLRAGADINMISFWLGYADINTTHSYVEIDMEMKRKKDRRCATAGSRQQTAMAAAGYPRVAA